MNRLARVIGLLVAWRAALRRPAGIELSPLRPRPEDEDPRERTVPANRRAEGLVALLLGLAGLTGFGFTAIYAVVGGNTQLLGLALGTTLALLGAAAIIAGKAVVPQETSVEARGPLLEEAPTEAVADMVREGGEGVSRRLLLAGAGGLAGAGLLTAAATPLASIGPNLETIHDTPWHPGVRLVDDQGRPLSADEIEVGAFLTALPQHGNPESFGSGILVVKLEPDQIHLPADRRDWAPEGIVAYSKICPHAGCAISLYRYPTYAPTSSERPAFTCPCHYSTFLPGEGGRLIFGPAGRALPQLPLRIDAARNLRAAGQFSEDIGPSWWSVRRPS